MTGHVWPSEIVDRFPVGLAQVNATGGVVQANPAFGALLGYAVELASGGSLDEAGWPVVRTASGLVTVVEAVLAGTELDGVFRVRGADGQARQLRVRGVPLDHVDGAGGGLFALVEVPDAIAEQHTVGQAVRAYESLADNLVDVVMVTSPREITWVSPSVRSALGYAQQDLVGRSIVEFVDPQEWTLPMSPEFPVGTVRHRMRHANGDYRWFETALAGQFDGDQLRTVFSTSRDVHDRVVLEAQLDAARQLQQDALDASLDGFAIYHADHDADGVVTGLRLEFINVAGAAGFAGDPSTLVGQDLRDLFPPAVELGLWADLITALHTGQPQRSRLEGPGPSWAGSMEGVQVRLNRDTVLSTWRDVSDQVRSEHRLAEAHTEATEARETLQAALDATSDGFVVFEIMRDAQQTATGLRVVTCNAAAVAPLGLTPDQICGRDPREFASTWEDAGLWDQILASTSDAQPRSLRVHVDDDAGQWVRSFDHTIAPSGRDRVVLTFRDVTADERARRDLLDSQRAAEYRATHDDLTGLPTREPLLRRLDTALASCLPDQRVGVIFCDLNDFKDVNDTYGHAAGDEVLRATADRLRAMIRPQDTAFRLAGDEFVVVLRHLPAGWDAAGFLTRAGERLSEPVLVGSLLLAPSASLGLHLADPHTRPETDTHPAGVVALADQAMYRVKQGFRSQSLG